MNKYICDTECVVGYELKDNRVCCCVCDKRTICSEVCDSKTCYVKRKIEIDKGEYQWS